MKRNVLNSPRLLELQRKRVRILTVKISFFIFLFLIVLTGLCFLSRWQEINIRNVEIVGNKVVSTESIEMVVRQELAGYYLWFFPKTNFLFYPKKNISEKLGNQFPRLKDITLQLKDTRTLSLSVSERLATHTWCGDDLPSAGLLPEESKCYFLDNSGYIFDEAPYFSNDVYFRFFGRVERDTDSPAGSSFFPEIFSKIVFSLDTFTEMGIKPSSLMVKEDGDIELYLKSGVLPPNSPKIIFKKDSDFNKVAENLQAALTTEPLQSDFKNKYSSLLYIDLRFGNKVYFKFSAQGGSASGGN
ncbi:MAG: hypothetical protein AAB943_01055 [Patescibacteria group bacterium]